MGPHLGELISEQNLTTERSNSFFRVLEHHTVQTIGSDCVSVVSVRRVVGRKFMLPVKPTCPRAGVYPCARMVDSANHVGEPTGVPASGAGQPKMLGEPCGLSTPCTLRLLESTRHAIERFR